MSDIDKKYAELGGENGFLKQPKTEELQCGDKEGRYRDYEGGSIYWHPWIGAYEVHGMIRSKWLRLGAEQSSLGYPRTDQLTTPDSKARYSHFQYGSIYWQTKTDEFKATSIKLPIYVVEGRIRERWAQYGWEKGFLGYPISNAVKTKTGTQQQFQGGTVKELIATGAIRVIKKASVLSPNYTVPIYAIQVSDDDGNRAAMIEPKEVKKWLEWANDVYAIAGIRFTYDETLEPLKDTKTNNVSGDSYNYWKEVKDRLNAMAKNKGLLVVFRYGENGPTGGGFSSDSYNFIVMPGFSNTMVCKRQNIGLFAHEMGHYFGLCHTFGFLFKTKEDAAGFFLIKGMDPRVFDGDITIIGDTPPDPYIEELQCRTQENAVVLAGTSLSICRDNVMSYWYSDFPPLLSAQQIERVRSALEKRAQEHGLIIHKKTN